MLKPPVVSDWKPALLKLPPIDAGLERGHADRVAAGEGQQLDILRLDRLPDRDVGLQQRRSAVTVTSSVSAPVSSAKSSVSDAGVELHAGPVVFLEALQLGGDVVAPG